MAASVSLVITTYNRAHFLKAAIESALKQTWQDFELLIWDDGSTDTSVDIAHSYAKRDSRIRVFAAPHLGRVLALKLAIAQTSGRYVGWLDDDDWLAPTALEETVAALDAEPDVGLVYTDYLEVDEQGNYRGYGRQCQIPYSKFRLLVDFMVFHFRLFRRSVYDQVGGVDEAFDYIEDYELCLRLSEITKIRRISKPLYFYRIHPNNITRQKRNEQIWLSQKAVNQALKRRGLDDRFKLVVEMPKGRFLLCRKPPIPSILKTACLPLALLPFTWTANSPAAFAQRITPAHDGTGTVVRHWRNQYEIRGGQTSQDGHNLFQSFEHFGLSKAEIANFISRPDIINILGRITGGHVSHIDGLLRITGGNSNLFLMNPAGIVFGANARLDLPGSFTATTATGIGFGSNWFSAVGDNNYTLLNGNPDAFSFTVDQPGVVVNAGNLSVAAGQNLSLLGGTVANTGQLSAPSGQLTAFAVPGQSMVRLSQPGNVLSLEVPIAPGSSQPNQWTLPITALPQLLTSNTGQNLGLQVNSNGQATLVNSGTAIPTAAGTVVASGRFDTSNANPGATGGRVQILGNTVDVVDADVNASGTNGGGTALIGGDYRGQGTVPNAANTSVSRNSTVDVSALETGNGGRAIIWSNGATTFHGEAMARGGRISGNGGLVETSGHQSLEATGSVDASAANGRAGTWLLDPRDITIGLFGAGDGYGIGSSQVDVNQLNRALNNGTNVAITTVGAGTEPGNITQLAGATISKTEGADTTLTLQADNNIRLNDSITTNNRLNINLVAGGEILTNTGTINAGSGDINFTADTITLTNRDNVPGSITGRNLTLEPKTPGLGIVIGGEGYNALSLSTADLNAIQNGFRSITIGRIDESGAVTIDGGAAPLFHDPVTIQSPRGITLNGNFLVDDNASITIRGTSFTSGGQDLIQTQGGSVDISVGAGNITAGDITTNGGNVNLRTQGDEFSGDIRFGTINSNGGAIGIIAAAGVGYGYGNVLGNGISSQGGNIDISATNRISVAPINSGTGNITLTGNEIDFRNQRGNLGTVTGSGNLLLQPSAPGLDIAIGGTGYGTALDLSDNDLASIQNGFSQITIGRNSSSGAVTVNGGATPLFRDPVTIQSPFGSINITGVLTTTDNASVTLNGATTFNQGGITTAGQPITINGTTTLNGNTALNTGATNGGTITLNGTANGNSALALNAGAGQVIIKGAIGNTAPLASLTVNGTANLNGGSVTTTGDQLYQNPLTLGADTTLTGNNITFNSTVRSDAAATPRALDVNTTALQSESGIATGTTTFNGEVGGGNRPLSRLTTNAEGQTVIGANITTSGNTMRFNNPVFLNADAVLRDTGNGGIIFNNTVDSRELPHSLTVTAPNGTIEFNGAVGSELPLSRLSAIAGNSVTLAAPITTRGNVNIRGNSIRANGTRSSQLNTNGGNITLRSNQGNIEVGAIATQGGNITVNSNRFFRALDTLPQRNSRNASIDAGGGAISITHAGGRRDAPVAPFRIGDATTNGTAGSITSGNNTIPVPQTIPGDFTQGNIEIKTDDVPERSIPPIPPTDIIPPKATGQPGSVPEFTPPIITLNTIASTEENTCREFQRYFGSETFGELAGGQNPCERLRTPEEITALLGNIAAQAGRRASIIYLIDTRDQLELVAFFPNGQPVRRAVPQANREALLKVVQEFRDEVNPVDIGKLNGTSYLASAQQLYQWLIAPLEADLRSHNIDTLAFIPSAGLRSLPFAALHDGKQFLVEKYSVGLLPSINLIDPRYRSVRGSEILAVGSGKWEERGVGLENLPSVPIEISSVVRQPWKGEALLDEQFTLDKIVTTMQNPSFQVLHLATHGEFQPGQPSDSYIQLWNTRLGLNQLRQFQLSQHQPPVELLTLSACRTALGDNSAELGFAGLALAAGAKSALASLWYVSDIGTLGLMTEFYRQLAQVPIKAEALQQTQIAMLRGQVYLEGNQLHGPTGVLQLSDNDARELMTQFNNLRVHDLRHPFFWAAFTMVGSPW